MRIFKFLKDKIRGYFFAGILIILPLGVTLYVITAVLKLMDRVLLIIPPKLQPQNYLPVKVPGLGLILSIVLVILTGILVKNYIGRKVVDFGEYVLSNIPFVRPVYGAVKQIIQAMFGETQVAFKRVILIEYPRKGVYALAFVTGVATGEIQGSMTKKAINVFLPTTPNPTSGFYLVVPEDETIPLSMSVEDAFKLLISGGMVSPESCLPNFRFGRRLPGAQSGKSMAQVALRSETGETGEKGTP